MPGPDYRFRWNNYAHPNLVAAFDMSTRTAGGLMKNLAYTGATYDATINGTYTPAGSLLRAKSTRCMDFGGVNEYLELTSPLISLPNLSVVAWGNVDALNTVLFCVGVAAAEWGQIGDGSGFPALRIGAAGPWGGASSQGGRSRTITGQTYMIAFTKNSSSVGTIYLDGKPYMAAPTGATGANATLYIGQYFGGASRFNGRMDNPMFFNIALTPAQVQAIRRSADVR